jgi:hypothetical protein
MRKECVIYKKRREYEIMIEINNKKKAYTPSSLTGHVIVL